MSPLLLNLILIALIKTCLCDDTIEISLKQGAVLGKVEQTLFKDQDYYAFRGIPYAAPPILNLRFQPPQPHEGWEGTLEAFENQPTCIQYSARMRNDEPFGISGSEDCLYINVFTPNIKSNAPVIVFDYNDDFKTGFNGTDTYSPDNFIEQDVVVVTISHRLGLFGYLTTEDNVIPSNNGLRDFILGLQWIQDNIKDFGGDPERVTLMGSCGGGSLVNIMLYSEKAKGLFSSAIIQSGSAFVTTFFYEKSRDIAFRFGAVFDIAADDSTTLLRGLQLIDAETLMRDIVVVMSEVDLNKNTQLASQPFTPIVEKNSSDAILSSLPEESPIVNDVPVIIGLNSREGIDFVSHFLFNPRILPPAAEEQLLQFPIRTGYRFEKDSAVYKKANIEIRDFYFETKNLDYTTVLEYAVYAGDMMQMYALNVAAEKLAASMKSNVYYYMFDFKGQISENSQYISRYSRYNLGHWGATVGDEICYLHICVRAKKYYLEQKRLLSEHKELKNLKRMVKLWTNFAKFGNPTPNDDDGVLNGFSWEPLKGDKDNMNYLHVTKTLKMEINPLGERAKFWREFLERYGQMAVDGVVEDEGSRDEL